jgi:hypothetical protein
MVIFVLNRANMEDLIFKVPLNLAKAFRNANAEKKKLAEMMVNLWLKDLLSEKNADEKLSEIMDRAASEAQKKGLTPEILNGLLNSK